MTSAARSARPGEYARPNPRRSRCP